MADQPVLRPITPDHGLWTHLGTDRDFLRTLRSTACPVEGDDDVDDEPLDDEPVDDDPSDGEPPGKPEGR